MTTQILVVKKLKFKVIRVGAAAVSVAVISGAAAERMTFIAWTILATIYSGFIYAALAHWTLAGGWY